MQSMLIELARLSVATQQAACHSLLDGIDQTGEHGLMWVERQLDTIPFIPETYRRWMEEWARIGKDGNNNLKNNLNDIFEGTHSLLDSLGQ